MELGSIKSTFLLIFAIANFAYYPVVAFFSQHHVNYDKFPRCTSQSKDIGSCIHKYLEKDFLSIGSIVYPKLKGETSDEKQCKSGEVVLNSKHIMMDGPTLDSSCNDLRHVYNCLLEELPFCDKFRPFFQLRHLLYTLKRIITWLCGTGGLIFDDAHEHSVVRSRFLVLLESIKCLECVRVKESMCRYDSSEVNITSNLIDSETLWHQILRMEIGQEQCSNIKKKMSCLESNNVIGNICGERARALYTNLTDLFVSTWCDQGLYIPIVNKGPENNCNVIMIYLIQILIYKFLF